MDMRNYSEIKNRFERTSRYKNSYKPEHYRSKSSKSEKKFKNLITTRMQPVAALRVCRRCSCTPRNGPKTVHCRSCTPRKNERSAHPEKNPWSRPWRQQPCFFNFLPQMWLKLKQKSWFWLIFLARMTPVETCWREVKCWSVNWFWQSASR